MRRQWILVGQSFLKTNNLTNNLGQKGEAGTERERARNHGRFRPAR